MNHDVYKIAQLGQGSLHVMAKPPSGLALEPTLVSLQESGIKRIVSLLAINEQNELSLDHEPALTVKHHMEFVSYPITDMGLPESIQGYWQFTTALHKDCCAGTHTVVHCHAGIGRSGIIAAGVLLHEGFEPQAALDIVSAKRTVPVPDTQAQIDWVLKCYSTMQGIAN